MIERGDFRIELITDRPQSGQWHCGPNSAWVQVTHLPTMIAARAYGRNHRQARSNAMACVEMLLEASGVTECLFPERVGGESV